MSCASLLLVAMAVHGASRRMLAFASIALTIVALPPHQCPTFWICLSPLVWIWRGRVCRPRLERIVIEALFIGFAIAWIATDFVRAQFPVWGELIHLVASSQVGFQFVILALAVFWTESLPVALSAAVSSGAFAIGEILYARYGIGWPLLSLSIAAADTPLIQFATSLTQIGVTAGIVLINCFWVLDRSERLVLQWRMPFVGVCLTLGSCMIGNLIENHVKYDALAFSVMLVQPHKLNPINSGHELWPTLDELTVQSIDSDGPVDLVVWPEASISETLFEAPDSDDLLNGVALENCIAAARADELSLLEFGRNFQPRYGAACLIGAPVRKPTTTSKYGLNVAERHRFNCACLVSARSRISTHEKLVLVPFKEAVPAFLDNRSGLQILPQPITPKRPFSPGRRFRSFQLETREGEIRTFAASVCYESLIPWLPQYRTGNHFDAIVHILYDGDTSADPELIECQIQACRYRAVETRTWNLICSTWTGSAIIDPRGKIVARLGPIEGVLRSDHTDTHRQLGQPIRHWQ